MALSVKSANHKKKNMQAPIKRRVEKSFFPPPFFFFLAVLRFGRADTESSVSAAGCAPWGSWAAPHNAAIAAGRAGGEETGQHGATESQGEKGWAGRNPASGACAPAGGTAGLFGSCARQQSQRQFWLIDL